MGGGVVGWVGWISGWVVDSGRESHGTGKLWSRLLLRYERGGWLDGGVVGGWVYEWLVGWMDGCSFSTLFVLILSVFLF